MDKNKELLEKLRNAKNGAWTFVHNINQRTLPYFTREPERAKFTNGFKPVVGALVRRSLDYSVDETTNGEIVDRKRLLTQIEVADDDKSALLSVFSKRAVTDAKLPLLLAYSPLTDGKESAGEIRIAEFINQLFGLSANNEWKQFLKGNESGNLYERLVVDNLVPLKASTESKDTFAFIDAQQLVGKFNHDLNNLMLSSNFFYSNYELFFAFYYFTYSVKLIAKIERSSSETGEFTPYYALDSENISQSRRAAGTQSFRTLRNSAKNLLPDSDVLVYLNFLIDKTDFLFLPQIFSLEGEERDNLVYSLRELLGDIEQKLTNVDNPQPLYLAQADLPALIDHLRTLIIKNTHDKAPMGRYVKSLDEIANFEFTKSRGRLGKTFNISEELEILLVGVVVGRNNMLLADFFTELEQRGIYLDRSSRDALAEDLDSRNLLEKMSDSGDAQYVKSLL